MTTMLTASYFKAHCLSLLDRVAKEGESLIVTKHGSPVARIEPVQAPATLRGSVTFAVSDEELIAPLPETWDAS
jgi:prevent-host-death family protein